MLRYGLRSYNFSVLKKGEKTAFLVRYGTRQIAFLTINPFKWCAIFRKLSQKLAKGL
jgi:hypothetical protein